MTESVVKATLSSGKVVLFREMKIRHQELAAKAVGNRHADADMARGLALQNELLKMLLVEVDGVKVNADINLDATFSMRDYQQCIKVIGQLAGNDDTAPLALEVVTSSGDK